MTEKELMKLKRSELLEIMLAQSREIDSLREELAQTKKKLADKRIKIKEAGSIAEASLQLTRIFEEAQKAADLYVENIRRRALQKEARLEQTKESGTETHHEQAAGRIDGEAKQNE
jgi:hypothetical protein